MSNAAQHTKTPWRASHGTGPVMQGYSQSSCVAGTGEHALKLIAGCFNDIGGDEVAAANASFIVRAVNSHDALVAALRKIARINPGSVADERAAEGDWSHFREPESVQIARATLAAAES